MEDVPGKLLDEACNQFNERYGDEVLYAAWAEPPRIAAEADESDDGCASPVSDRHGNEAEAFLARMYACQG